MHGSEMNDDFEEDHQPDYPLSPELALLITRGNDLLARLDAWMPPLHNKANIGPLTPEQIGLIRAWIDQGAK